jgi:hypothetical protein
MKKWRLYRLVDGSWVETGEVFYGSDISEVDAYLAVRQAEDGWPYSAELVT